MQKIIKVVKQNLKHMHWGLFFVVLALVIFGLFNIITASSRETVANYNYDLLHFFNRHLVMLVIAVALSIIIINLPTTLYLFLGP